MEEKERYKQMISTVLKICGCLVLLILFFILREKLLLVSFVSGSIVLIGVILSIAIEFLGFSRETAKVFVVISPIYYAALIIFIISINQVTPKSTLSVLVIIAGVSIVWHEIPKWKEATRYLKSK